MGGWVGGWGYRRRRRVTNKNSRATMWLRPRDERVKGPCGMIDWRWVYPTEMPANERRVIRAHSVWVPAGRVSTRTRVHHRGSCQQGVFYLEKKTLKKLNACVCACVCRRQQIERTDVKGMRVGCRECTAVSVPARLGGRWREAAGSGVCPTTIRRPRLWRRRRRRRPPVIDASAGVARSLHRTTSPIDVVAARRCSLPRADQRRERLRDRQRRRR